LQQLEGSWIKLERTAGSPDASVSFHDPSCRDFILGLIESEPDYLIAILEQASGPGEISLMLGYCCARKPVANPSPPRRNDRRPGHAFGFGEIMEVFFGGETVPKYPHMERTAESQRPYIASLVKRSWQLHRPDSPHTAIEVLADLLDRDDKLNLGIEHWIHDETYKLDALPHDGNGAAYSLYKLLSRLMDDGRRPTTPEEARRIGELFDAWCWMASDEIDWSRLNEFMGWLNDSPELDDALSASFYSHFEAWAESELENTVDLADDEDGATAALDHLRRAVTEYLGDGSMQEAFANAAQRTWRKFSGYEPDPEDLEHLRETAAAVEGEEEEEPYVPASTPNAHDAPPSDDDVIRDMFRQLT
jgi:hypothetical protein